MSTLIVMRKSIRLARAGHRAAENGDELPPSHVEHGASFP
jgi:hypothetical protein